MEEIKQGWKKRISWLLIAITVVIVYKMLDNFSSVQAWFGSFLRILKPFLIGILISYILCIPCTKIEKIFKKSKLKLIAKRSRGLSVIVTYIIFVLILIIIINKNKISKDIQALGIALMSASIFQIVACQIITSNVDVKNIKIFNDVFSNCLVTIIQDVLNKINSLALGTCIFAVIILGIYVSIKVNKKTKDEPEQNEAE